MQRKISSHRNPLKNHFLETGGVCGTERWGNKQSHFSLLLFSRSSIRLAPSSQVTSQLHHWYVERLPWCSYPRRRRLNFSARCLIAMFSLRRLSDIVVGVSLFSYSIAFQNALNAGATISWCAISNYFAYIWRWFGWKLCFRHTHHLLFLNFLRLFCTVWVFRALHNGLAFALFNTCKAMSIWKNHQLWFVRRE